MPTPKINAAVARLNTAIREGDSAIYRIRQQEPAMQPNAYREALKTATDKAHATVKEARQGITDAIAAERATLTRQAGPKADNPAERALYATRAAGIAAQGPEALLRAVRAELTAGNKTAAQEYLLIGKGMMSGVAGVLELQQLTRQAADDSTAAASVALAGLDAYEAKTGDLDAWHMEHILESLGNGNVDPAPGEGDNRPDMQQRVSAWGQSATEAAGAAAGKAQALYGGESRDPYDTPTDPTGGADSDAPTTDGGEGQ